MQLNCTLFIYLFIIIGYNIFNNNPKGLPLRQSHLEACCRITYEVRCTSEEEWEQDSSFWGVR